MASVNRQEAVIIVCRWCGRRLDTGYYFKCNDCSATYCFIHQDKHRCTVRAVVTRKSRRRRKVVAV